jgi:spore coat protein U-like protein
MNKVDSRFQEINRQPLVALAVFGLMLAPSAQAGSNTGNMTVTANIQAACTVSASPMAFGTVVPGTNKDTVAVVSSNCTAGTAYTVDIGNGINSIATGGTGGQFRRQMAAGTYLLPYVIYIDATRATPIDASAVALNNLLTTTVGDGLDKTTSIFGRVIGAESTVNTPGSYVDTVLLTIAF